MTTALPADDTVLLLRYTAAMNFEWDPDKAESNVAKHGVDFAEASTVFADYFALTIFDPDHSDSEDRYITIGLSDRARVLVVSHTDRDAVTRIIGSRNANRLEIQAYNDARS